MKKNKESGRSGLLIAGSAALAALVAWLALHEGEKNVPVVSGTRARVADVLRNDAEVHMDAGVRMNDAGTRMRLAAAIRKTRQAVSKGNESPPKEPLTKDNALERARSGDLVAAQLIVNIANDKYVGILSGEEADFDEIGMTEDEYNTFGGAIDIADALNNLEDPSTLDFNDEDDILDLNYGGILHTLKEIGPSGANNPLLAQLIERNEQGLRDLVQEAVGRYPTMKQNGNLGSENPLTDEDIANLRKWYELD